MPESKKPTREELIAICERAFVPEEHWRNRDTSGAQRQLGECYALLKAGCEFMVRRDIGRPDDEGTIWLAIAFNGFGYYDYGGPQDDETYYLPSAKRLDAVAGKDWY